MLTDAFQDYDDGFPIRYKMFNLRTLQVNPKVQTDVQNELLYAGDMATNASTESKMQKAMARASEKQMNRQ